LLNSKAVFRLKNLYFYFIVNTAGMTHIAIYRVFFFLLDRQAPAQVSASGTSYAACRGGLTVYDVS